MLSNALKSSTPDALAASGRALALLFAVALAGCQNQTTVPTEHVQPVREPAAVMQIIPQEDVWLMQAPEETQTPQDIWARVREGFRLQEHLDNNPRIEQQRLYFAGRAKSIEAASVRGAPYIHYIVERLEEQEMPLELALLPIIESAYDPFAYSPSQAVGLWQFIPSTGRNFNLRQTNWYDGRRDITASTHAALRYMNYLHSLFNGDWLLALAAYNAGEGTVSRAIERNQKLGLPTDYWNLSLPQETRDYVPKLLALSQLVLAPQAYGINLNPIANEPYFEAIALKQPVALSQIAKLAELDEDEIYQLNPAFTRRITQDGPQQLLVPSEKAEMLMANLALMKPQEPVQWQQYKVRAGDTLGSIANRHSLSVSVIRDINRLPHDRLRIGQTLNIPGADGQSLHVVKHSPAPRSYRVKTGDNLWDIAKSQRVSVRDLQRWNNLSGSSLKVGQTLHLQDNGTGIRANGQRTPTYYQVKPGDSLHRIAKRFNIRINHLKNWNPQQTAALKPGQTLTLYLAR
ncbi:LysM peptidoglycan-binding domain-containing protein [Pseudomonas sp. ABC1]|uniref:LysM peptidoglycan-binding domain-containing protein n=1 Tax=Pseudomonas sp. ABC1 TaxID=2748080 RepID=UPI0015C31EE0|nr:LysM peptidoglycan-binding domain-containing protein [Pseudomonas sp. ABC1]QLF94860.1 LysM peptidoglycan-binding domain-containing protein [Pseudomonas sp. ABC1]